MQTLEWGAAAAGIASAALWWMATWKSITNAEVPSLGNSKADEGDIALQTAPDQYIIYRWGRVARLNAAAAFCAGLAILLQTLAGLLQ